MTATFRCAKSPCLSIVYLINLIRQLIYVVFHSEAAVHASNEKCEFVDYSSLGLGLGES